jgi:hypothetical protein
MNETYGVIAERVKDTDWLGSDIILPRAPQGTNSFVKNGVIQYDQRQVASHSCPIHGAIGAYSALTGRRFTLDERKELWALALELGAIDGVGWYINEAVDLVRRYVNDNASFVDKVSSYRVALDSLEFGTAMRLGYSVIVGYRGNSEFNKDRDDNDILNGLDFINTTYGHCVHTNYSVGDEFDRVVDSYLPRPTNLFRIPTANWKRLVMNRIFMKYGYIYLIK